jgi:hypothetical protein
MGSGSGSSQRSQQTSTAGTLSPVTATLLNLFGIDTGVRAGQSSRLGAPASGVCSRPLGGSEQGLRAQGAWVCSAPSRSRPWVGS